MKTIDFKKRSEDIEIAGVVYSVEVSNYEFIKQAKSFVIELEASKNKMMETEDIDDMLACIKKLVDFVLKDYDRIWEAAGHDIYNMLDVAVALSEVISSGLEYKMGKYL